MTTVKNIYDYLNSIAPFDSQEEWDNSGHLVGKFRKEVKKAVLALDCTKAVSRFSADINADLVITHHPVIFSPVKDIKEDSALFVLVSNDISQISLHTNFDRAEQGININLAALLGIENAKLIDDGFVAVGELSDEMSIDDLAELVNDKLDVSGIRYTDTDKPIKKVAVGGGACSEYIDVAMQNADCFVTGDLKYHDMLEADEMGFPVISAGHYETENIPFLMLKEKLSSVFTDVEFVIAPRQNPIKSV